MDGSVRCFTGWHAPLGLLALLMLLLCIALLPLTVIMALHKYPSVRLVWSLLVNCGLNALTLHLFH